MQTADDLVPKTSLSVFKAQDVVVRFHYYSCAVTPLFSPGHLSASLARPSFRGGGDSASCDDLRRAPRRRRAPPTTARDGVDRAAAPAFRCLAAYSISCSRSTAPHVAFLGGRRGMPSLVVVRWASGLLLVRLGRVGASDWA
ncbi:hypothetical protein EJB05_25431, partial [Eragrostis curvula]